MAYRRLLAHLVVGFAISVTAMKVSASPAEHPVIGSGSGVDHATLLTHSLVTTSRTFTDLGFTVSPIGSYDNGFENSAIYFADGTYLELFGVHDAQMVAQGSQAHAAEGVAGLTWVSLETSSMEKTVAHLQSRGHTLFGPEAIPDEGAWSYKIGGLEQDSLPGHRVYFIEYNHDRLNASRQEKLEAWQAKETHRNGAQGLQAAWVAVRDLAEAERIYEDSGFTLGKRISLPHLNAIAREIPTKDRAILLIEPASDSAAAQSVSAERAAFVGYSIRVNSLRKVRSILAENKMAGGVEYVGPHGPSLLVPPDNAGGSWLEFFE